MNINGITTGISAQMHNGPICYRCGATYIGSHACTCADFDRRIAALEQLRDQTCAPVATQDQTSTCPCRPENGGSGVCGCIRGGPTVTC